MQSDYLGEKSILRNIGPSTPTLQATWWSATTNSPTVDSWNASIMQSDYLGEKSILRNIDLSNQPPTQVVGRRPQTPQPLRAGMPQSCKVIISAKKAFCVT